MDDNVWIEANVGGRLTIAKRYIADNEPVLAIGGYLLAINVMHIHIGRMDDESDLVRTTASAAIANKQNHIVAQEKTTA